MLIKVARDIKMETVEGQPPFSVQSTGAPAEEITVWGDQVTRHMTPVTKVKPWGDPSSV